MIKKKELEKLVSLTFDEDPLVRINAAKKLSEVDDPIAVFAISELVYDKDEGVRNFARNLVKQIEEKKKEQEGEKISFAEMFKKGAKKEEIVQPLEKALEEKIGKEKASEVFKDIELDEIASDEKRQTILQQIINKYFNFVDSLDEVGKEENDEALDIEESKLEIDEIEELETIRPQTSSGDCLYDYFYKVALDSKGSKKAKSKLIKEIKTRIETAFDIVNEKLGKLKTLSDIKKGMRKFYSTELIVKKIEIKVRKTRRKETQYYRIELEDELGAQGVLYLLDKEIDINKLKGSKIQIEDASIREVNGEVAIVVNKKKGKVVIVL